MISLSEIRNANILIVDDQESNVQLLEGMLGGTGYNSVMSTMNPHEVARLHRSNGYDLILLDINMPQKNGFDVIESLREVEEFGYLPVLAMTAEPSHKLRALTCGAKDFVCKPFEIVEMLSRINNMIEVRLLHRQLHAGNAQLDARVRERSVTLRDAYREAISTMTDTLVQNDSESGLHLLRTSYYCEILAEGLGMDGQFREEISYASKMHDIGKVAIPDRILSKDHDLMTADEWQVIQSHTIRGAEILRERQSPYLQMGMDIALCHHERWNGSGYPNRLVGKAIPLSARIMAVADVYDSLRSTSSYRAGFSHERALKVMMRGDERTLPDYFDPDILGVFLDASEEFREVHRSSSDAN